MTFKLILLQLVMCLAAGAFCWGVADPPYQFRAAVAGFAMLALVCAFVDIID